MVIYFDEINKQFRYEPNYVAQRMITSILNKDKEVLVAILLHKVAIWIRFFFPNLFFWFMSKRAKKTFDKKYQG